MQIISSDKENLLSSSKLFFKNSSSDLISSKNIYIIADDYIENMQCSISDNDVFKLFFVNAVPSLFLNTEEGFTSTNYLDLTTIQSEQQGSKIIYRISMYFSSSDAGIYNAQMKLIIDGKTYMFNLIGESIELDEKLVVTLQNFRQSFSDDYLIAFFESNPKSNAVDYGLYNRKIREFLLNIHDLTVMHGSYKNLFAALKFFGYGDLLDLREYWTNGNIYKSTSIANYVLNYIDKSLASFKKTNKMSLVYQINEETGLDEDGLPLYTTIFQITEEIMLKMEALKRILEKDFLHFNTFIVDIIGEMQTVVGLELNVIWNDALISSIHLTDNLYVDVDKHLDVELLKMKVNKVKVKNWLHKITNDQLIDNPDFTDYENAKIFEIESIYYSPEDVQNDEYIQNYYLGTFGIIKIDIILNKSRYQTYSYRIYDKTEKVYDSGLKQISEFNNKIICGVSKAGFYKIDIIFTDWYGGSTVVGYNDYFEVQTNDIVMKMLSFNHQTKTSRLTMPSAIKTYDETKNKVPFQKINQDFDINTYDQLANTTNLQIKTNYSNDVDVFATYCRLNELTAVPLKQLDKIKIENLGSTCAVILCDMIGDQGIEGDRIFEIYDSATSTWYSVKKSWVPGEIDQIWISDFCKQLREEHPEVKIFQELVFDYQLFGVPVSDTHYEKVHMLRIRAKENSYRTRFINFTISEYAPNPLLQKPYMINDIYINEFIHPIYCQAIQYDEVNDHLKIYISDKTYTIENVVIHTPKELEEVIKQFAEENHENLYAFSDSDNSLIYLSSDKEFYIEHQKFGKIGDVPRGEQFKVAYELEHGVELKFGETFIAEFDNMNLSDMHDIVWYLYDEITGRELTVQHSNRLVYIAKRRTTYSIKVEYQMHKEKYSTYHKGCFLVK